jgi:hypothetical protein
VASAYGAARWLPGTCVVGVIVALSLSSPADAGNDANFVLYDHHLAKAGEAEINVYTDTANIGSGEENYAAQLLELEYGVTRAWTSAFYIEGDHIEGEEYEFGGFRFENRVRLFDRPTFLNPVLYAEYEHLTGAHRYLLSVTGRTDTDNAEEAKEGENAREEAEEETEDDIETKLILGHDFSDRLNVAFNWTNETNLRTGKWEFGYAAGLNYVLSEAENESKGKKGARKDDFDLEKLTLGLEVYGGLGDSIGGLTIDPGKTEQYLGINLQAEWENGVHVGVGGAFGLTRESENAILRLIAGYEF